TTPSWASCAGATSNSYAGFVRPAPRRIENEGTGRRAGTLGWDSVSCPLEPSGSSYRFRDNATAILSHDTARYTGRTLHSRRRSVHERLAGTSEQTRPGRRRSDRRVVHQPRHAAPVRERVVGRRRSVAVHGSGILLPRSRAP